MLLNLTKSKDAGILLRNNFHEKQGFLLFMVAEIGLFIGTVLEAINGNYELVVILSTVLVFNWLKLLFNV